MPKRTGTSRVIGWWAEYRGCGCISEQVRYKRELLDYCPKHGSNRLHAHKVFAGLEKAVEHDIDKALSDLGFDVTRLSQARHTMQTRGIPDRYARSARFGLRLWVEIKRPGGQRSIYQEAWHQAELLAGGDVVTVDSVKALLLELKKRGVPITITSGET